MLCVSAISDYSQYNVLRNKIINSLRSNNYINFYDHEEENGGILLDLKSRRNPDQIYLKYQWSLKFFEKTCHIEHYFTINATEFGSDIIVFQFIFLIAYTFFFICNYFRHGIC